MLKKFWLALLCFSLVWLKLSHAADKAEEEIMRPALVSSLVKQVNWLPEKLKLVSGKNFNLCIYKHRPTYRSFAKHLNALSIQTRKVEVKLLAHIKDIVNCHAMFIREADVSDSLQIINAIQDKPVLLIGDGKNAAPAGFHIGVYVGDDGFFEFDINLDAFYKTRHTPNLQLFALGKVVSSPIASKVNVMRSLISYTEWPEQAISSEFVICGESESIFSTYAAYRLKQKPIKMRLSRFQQIDNDSSTENCHVILVDNEKSALTKKLIFERANSKALLIGNDFGLGNKGVHYNLALPKNEIKYKFELNLIALHLSGFKPHFQLVNSALVVKLDFAALSEKVTQILSATQWPQKDKLKLSDDLSLCIWASENNFNAFNYFYPDITKVIPSIKLIKSNSAEVKCAAILVLNATQQEWKTIARIQKSNQALLISESGKDKQQLSHYFIKIMPNKIEIKENKESLKKLGFVANIPANPRFQLRGEK